MNVEKELKKKTIFDPLYSTTEEADCATGIASNAIEHWVEGGKPCPKCGSFHTQKNIAMCLTTYPCQYQFKCMNCSHTWTDHEGYDGGLSYQPQPENLNLHKEYGWICPKCGRVYAPHMSWCTQCNGTYSPNFVYCRNIGTIEGDVSISKTADTSNIYATDTQLTRNRIDGTLTATFTNASEDNNGNKSNLQY